VTPSDQRLHHALLELVGRFGAERLCVVERGLKVDASVKAVVEVPEGVDPLVAPLIYLPPLQVLTYSAAIARGLDPDQPAFAETMLQAMLPAGRTEPDWQRASTHD
jgi:glucosamine 6-phosphate synthetase-like amidotransferase/phosphosugar isomerase protein